MSVYSYEIGNSLYINVTNKCPNKCSFCIRETTEGVREGSLWLDEEPSVTDIINSIKNPNKYAEFVFCGFGEPLVRLDIVLQTAKILRKYGKPIRVNTNGLANLIHGKDITPYLEKVIDIVSISLNAENKEKYQKVCESVFGEQAFNEVLSFAKMCKKYVSRVILSVVNLPEVDIERCRQIAVELGTEFKVRNWSPDI